jgi:hypothetical protein
MIKDYSFLCDADQSKSSNLKWFKDNNNVGLFMNGFDNLISEINCRLDRHSAWRGGGDVWFVMYARRDTSEGEFLMWKYNPFAGASLRIPGVSISFD